VERVEGPYAPALKPSDTIVRVDPHSIHPTEVETPRPAAAVRVYDANSEGVRIWAIL